MATVPRRRSDFSAVGGAGAGGCPTKILTFSGVGASGKYGAVQSATSFTIALRSVTSMPARPKQRLMFDAYTERRGVCRDFAHLAITFYRCMNVPARYCTGYLGDIGVPPDPAPMDFSAWFEAYLGGRWYTFDARHNKPRIGRILMAKSRDATDVAIVTSFGPCQLSRFKVFTEEVTSAASTNV
jgi:transglutaminase superfamily protein